MSEQLDACSASAFLVQSNDTDSTAATTWVIAGHMAHSQAKLQAVVLYRTEYKCTHHILVISLPVPTSKSLSAEGRFLGFFVSATLTNCWKTGLLEKKGCTHLDLGHMYFSALCPLTESIHISSYQSHFFIPSAHCHSSCLFFFFFSFLILICPLATQPEMTPVTRKSKVSSILSKVCH